MRASNPRNRRPRSKKQVAIFAVAGLAVADGVGIWLVQQHLNTPWAEPAGAAQEQVAAADPVPAIRPDELRAPPSMVLATLPPAAPVAIAPLPVPEVAALAAPAVEREMPTYVPSSTLAAKRNAGMASQLVRLETRRAPSRKFVTAFPVDAASARAPDAVTAGFVSPPALDTAAAVSPAQQEVLDSQIAETSAMAETQSAEIAPAAPEALPEPEFGVPPAAELPASDAPAESSELPPG